MGFGKRLLLTAVVQLGLHVAGGLVGLVFDDVDEHQLVELLTRWKS